MTPLLTGMLLCIVALAVALVVVYSQLQQLKQGEGRARARALHMPAWEPMIAMLRTLPPSARELHTTESRNAKPTLNIRGEFDLTQDDDVERLPGAPPGLNLPWWTRAALLERDGYSFDEIARELEIPVAEVELVLALGYPSRGE